MGGGGEKPGAGGDGAGIQLHTTAPNDRRALSGGEAAPEMLINTDTESAAWGPVEAVSGFPLAPNTRMSWLGQGL